MRPFVVRRMMLAVIVLTFFVATPAKANMADVVAATYREFSMTAPTTSSVFVCHGFGCKFRHEVAFSDADRAKLTQLMAPGKASPVAERKAVGEAGAWFDRRIAADAGTVRHVARADAMYMNDAGQFDCIDSSRNSTTLLLVLEQLKLLRHHHVDPPKARGYFLDFHLPHVTAVLTENASGVSWSVDSWTRGYGQAPEIMPMSVWETLD